VVHFFRRYWGTWDEYALEPAEIIDAGQDRVVVVHYERGSGKGSGLPLERRWAVVYTLSAGRLVKIDQFATRQQALKAAGPRE
jgi:ketosteroid isomerase-like protein